MRGGRPLVLVAAVVAALAVDAVVASLAATPGAGGAAARAEGASPAFERGALGGRAYRLFVPGALPPRPALVVALHGCWQTPEDFARGTRLNEAAARRGLLVLYPVQGRRDNASRCWNWFEPAHQSRVAGELAQIVALVEEVRRRYPGERERTVAVGFSAGAFMVVNLACTAPDVVSGVGVVAGGPYRCGLGVEGGLQCMRGQARDEAASARECLAAADRARRPLRVSVWHGERDPVVHPANFEALVTMFARVTGMVSGASEPREGALYSLYRDARGEPRLEAWLVPALAHAWSGGDARGSHAVAWGPSATDRILDFLLAS